MAGAAVAAAVAAAAALAAAGAGGAHAHSLFNSAEEFTGGYRVQIATLPEFPQIGGDSEVLIRVTDASFEEVGGFTMGMRLSYQGEQVAAFAPRAVDGGHWRTGFVFEEPGNHIVHVDLYDMNAEGEVLTYTFNVGTQSPFGYVFIAAITFGAAMFAAIVGYVYLPGRLRRGSGSAGGRRPATRRP